MAGSSWGTREELLHPRDRKGRWRKKWGMSAAKIKKVLGMLDAFNEHLFGSDREASDYIKSTGRGLGREGRGPTAHRTSPRAIRDLLTDYDGIQSRMRSGKTTPSDKSTIAGVEAAMEPSDRDLALSRVVPAESFSLTPQTLQGDGTVDAEGAENEGIKEWTGKLISDRAFSTVTIGTPIQSTGQNVRMVVAAPKGTRMVHPPDTPDGDRQLILAPDQPLQVTKVDWDESTRSWNMYAIAVPKSGKETPTPIGGPEAPPSRQLVEEANLPEPQQAVPGGPPVRDGEPVVSEGVGGAPERMAPIGGPAPVPAPGAQETPLPFVEFREALQRRPDLTFFDDPLGIEGKLISRDYKMAIYELQQGKDPRVISRRMKESIASTDEILDKVRRKLDTETGTNIAQELRVRQDLRDEAIQNDHRRALDKFLDMEIKKLPEGEREESRLRRETKEREAEQRAIGRQTRAAEKKAVAAAKKKAAAAEAAPKVPKAAKAAAPAAPKKKTIAQLRAEAGDIKIPASVKKRDDIEAFLEGARRGEEVLPSKAVAKKVAPPVVKKAAKKAIPTPEGGPRAQELTNDQRERVLRRDADLSRNEGYPRNDEETRIRDLAREIRGESPIAVPAKAAPAKKVAKAVPAPAAEEPINLIRLARENNIDPRAEGVGKDLDDAQRRLRAGDDPGDVANLLRDRAEQRTERLDEIPEEDYEGDEASSLRYERLILRQYADALDKKKAAPVKKAAKKVAKKAAPEAPPAKKAVPEVSPMRRFGEERLRREEGGRRPPAKKAAPSPIERFGREREAREEATRRPPTKKEVAKAAPSPIQRFGEERLRREEGQRVRAPAAAPAAKKAVPAKKAPRKAAKKAAPEKAPSPIQRFGEERIRREEATRRPPTKREPEKAAPSPIQRFGEERERRERETRRARAERILAPAPEAAPERRPLSDAEAELTAESLVRMRRESTLTPGESDLVSGALVKIRTNGELTDAEAAVAGRALDRRRRSGDLGFQDRITINTADAKLTGRKAPPAKAAKKVVPEKVVKKVAPAKAVKAAKKAAPVKRAAKKAAPEALTPSQQNQFTDLSREEQAEYQKLRRKGQSHEEAVVNAPDIVQERTIARIEEMEGRPKKALPEAPAPPPIQRTPKEAPPTRERRLKIMGELENANTFEEADAAAKKLRALDIDRSLAERNMSRGGLIRERRDRLIEAVAPKKAQRIGPTDDAVAAAKAMEDWDPALRQDFLDSLSPEERRDIDLAIEGVKVAKAPRKRAAKKAAPAKLAEAARLTPAQAMQRFGEERIRREESTRARAARLLGPTPEAAPEAPPVKKAAKKAAKAAPEKTLDNMTRPELLRHAEANDIGGIRPSWNKERVREHIRQVEGLKGEGDLEGKARTRQKVMDQATGRARALSTIEEIITNEGSERALRHRIQTMVKMDWISEAEAKELDDLHADRPALIARIDQMAERNGLTRIERAGDIVTFDRKKHAPIGRDIETGQQVHVVRQGYRFDPKDGEGDVLVDRAVVEKATPGEKPDVVKPKAPPAKKLTRVYVHHLSSDLFSHGRSKADQNMLDDVQKDLDEGKLTPAAIGRKLETRAKGAGAPSVHAAYAEGVADHKKVGETDAEFETRMAGVRKENEPLRKSGEDWLKLAHRLKGTRRTAVPETPASAPAKKVAKKAARRIEVPLDAEQVKALDEATPESLRKAAKALGMPEPKGDNKDEILQDITKEMARRELASRPVKTTSDLDEALQRVSAPETPEATRTKAERDIKEASDEIERLAKLPPEAEPSRSERGDAIAAQQAKLRDAEARLEPFRREEEAGRRRDDRERYDNDYRGALAESGDDGSMDEKILDTYKERRRGDQWIGLAELRQEIGGSREEQDRSLQRLLASRDVRIIPVANSKALTREDREAALQIGGEDTHALQVPEGAPNVRRILAERQAPTPAKKAVTPVASPGTAAGKITAGRLTPGTRILVRQRDDGVWEPTNRKTGSKAITFEGVDAVGGRARARLVVRGRDDDGNEIRVENTDFRGQQGVPAHQTFLLEPPPRAAKAAKKAAAPKKPSTEDRVVAHVVDRMTPEARKGVFEEMTPEERTEVEGALKRVEAEKLDSASLMKRLSDFDNPPSREEAHELIKDLKPAELRAMARELSVPNVSRLNKQQLRDEVVQATSGAREDSIATRGFRGRHPGPIDVVPGENDPSMPTVVKEQRPKGQEKLADALLPAADKPKASKSVPPAKQDPRDVSQAIRQATSREEARRMLDGKTIKDLREIAEADPEHKVVVRSKTKDGIKDDIVHSLVGSRLDSEAIRQTVSDVEDERMARMLRGVDPKDLPPDLQRERGEKLLDLVRGEPPDTTPPTKKAVKKAAPPAAEPDLPAASKAPAKKVTAPPAKAAKKAASGPVSGVDYSDPELLKSQHAREVLDGLESGDSRDDIVEMYMEDGINRDMAEMMVDEVIKARDIQAKKAPDGLNDMTDASLRSLATEFEVPNPKDKNRIQLLRALRRKGAVNPATRQRPEEPAATPKKGLPKGEPTLPQETPKTTTSDVAPDAPVQRAWNMTSATGSIPRRERPGNDEPVRLINGGADQGNIHLDSEIGELWADLYMDDREPNSFINEIGSLETDLSMRRQTPDTLTEAIKKLKALKGRASSPATATRIQTAIDAMDAPEVRTPDLPDTVPDFVRKYLDELAKIPTARKTGSIGTENRRQSVFDAKVDAIRQIDAASGDRHELDRALSARDTHEGMDGSYAIWKLNDEFFGPGGKYFKEYRLWRRDAEERKEARDRGEAPKAPEAPAPVKKVARRAARGEPTEAEVAQAQRSMGVLTRGGMRGTEPSANDISEALREATNRTLIQERVDARAAEIDTPGARQVADGYRRGLIANDEVDRELDLEAARKAEESAPVKKVAKKAAKQVTAPAKTVPGKKATPAKKTTSGARNIPDALEGDQTHAEAENNINNMLIAELKELARELGIANWDSLGKDDLRTKIFLWLDNEARFAAIIRNERIITLMARDLEFAGR